MNSAPQNILARSNRQTPNHLLGWIQCAMLGALWLVGCADPTPVAVPPQKTDQTQTDHVTAGSEVLPGHTALKDQQAKEVVADEPTAEATTTVPHFDPEQLKFSMVTVGTTSDAGLGYGVVFEQSSTGFDVITADHVLVEPQNVVVHAWETDGTSTRLQAFRSVTIMHRSPGQDLAWLRVRGRSAGIAKLELAKHVTVDRQPAWTFRVDHLKPVFELNEIESRVTAMRDSRSPSISYWRLKKAVEPGLSGGGLVDAKGRWLGIASGNSQKQAHYIDEGEIDRFLRDAGLR